MSGGISSLSCINSKLIVENEYNQCKKHSIFEGRQDGSKQRSVAHMVYEVATPQLQNWQKLIKRCDFVLSGIMRNCLQYPATSSFENIGQ